jgi:SNF2 family DNA or RNA helicase
MLDESSLIQNPTAKRTKFIMVMRPDNVILLSGTPTGGKYERLMTQMHLLGWNINEVAFWNQYVDWEWQELDGFYQRKIIGYKNEERLKRKMREHGCDFLKTDEVFDLPQQIDQTISIPTTKEYKRFKKGSYLELKDGTQLIGDCTLNQMLYERQLCGQYNLDKVNALRDLSESSEDRFIVFYNFNAELDILKGISDALERPYSVVNGKDKDLTAYEDKSDSMTFIQYQAGAMGLNLQKANKVIYFTPPLSSELFEQSKKRIHRINQTRTCFYYYLTCKNSVEEHIYATLRMRKDYTEKLFEGGD